MLNTTGQYAICRSEQTYPLIDRLPKRVCALEIQVRRCVTANDTCCHVNRIASHQYIVQRRTNRRHSRHRSFSGRHFAAEILCSQNMRVINKVSGDGLLCSKTRSVLCNCSSQEDNHPPQQKCQIPKKIFLKILRANCKHQTKASLMFASFWRHLGSRTTAAPLGSA